MLKIVIMIVVRNVLTGSGLRQVLSDQRSFDTISIVECDPSRGRRLVVAQIEEHLPDVVIIDIDHPSHTGLELMRYVTRRCPGTKVVALSANPCESDAEIIEVIKTGASAYLRSRDCAGDVYVDTIRRTAAGEYAINDLLTSRPRLVERVLKQFQEVLAPGSRPVDSVASSLTYRELQILELIAHGGSNTQIADALSVSDQTIKNHVGGILRKMNANARAHAVFLALRDGVLSIDGSGRACTRRPEYPSTAAAADNPDPTAGEGCSDPEVVAEAALSVPFM